MSEKFIYSFNEGSKEMRDLLGGKGADLAEMTRIGLPVPFGFTVTTEACNRYYEDGGMIDEEIIKEIFDKVAELMYDSGLIRYKGLFKIFCKFCDAETKVGPGTYTLNTKYDYHALIKGTTPGSAQLVEVELTIPEGYTMKQIFTLSNNITIKSTYYFFYIFFYFSFCLCHVPWIPIY